MEAQSLVSHQHSWWFSCFSLREKLARSHNKTNSLQNVGSSNSIKNYVRFYRNRIFP